ncbi:ATP-binding cassette (ABC) Superfamily [Phytophthora palmivora]|uniref:ATP-binding cassette (ABC) Superfamily n=1 Tax=Phytophthora palmivora TaxID=4796 RepID=A0A2P4YKG5_9STRA|nr:ATP-binding cassette (ABC) Superfamily [Phytophthora palmivora]
MPNEASARKRSASQSLYISDQYLDEVYNEDPPEFANNLDEQQEELLAARLARQPVHPLGSNPRSRVFPDEGHGSLLFLEQTMDPHPLTGGQTSLGAYERHLIKGVPLEHSGRQVRSPCTAQNFPKGYTRLGKKSETNGGLDPVWGFPWVQPENTSSAAQVEALFWSWRDLRVQFAHLVVKRQIVTEMEPYPVQLLRISALLTKLLPLFSEHNIHQAVCLEPICEVGYPRHFTWSWRSPERSRSDQGWQEELSHAVEYEAPSQPYPSGLPHSGPGPAESFLQDEVHQPRDRIYAIEIALGIGLGGLAAAQPGKPTALDVLRQDVNALGLEVQKLHKRIDSRVPASALKELRWSHDAPVYEAHGQMPSYEPQWYSSHSAYGYSS